MIAMPALAQEQRQHPGYNFSVIAQSGEGSTFRELIGAPAINNSGTVAFVGNTFDSGGGIFSSAGSGSLTIITLGSGFGTLPSINDAGTVAFLRSDGQIAIGSGGPVIVIESGAFREFLGNHPSINNAGQVAYRKSPDDFFGFGPSLLRVGNGTSVTTIATTTGAPFSRFGSIGNSYRPSINNNGMVAFQASLDAGGSGIFTLLNGTLTTVADTSGIFSSFGVNPSLSDNGMVAFLASLRAGGSGIFLGNGSMGGSTSLIADTASSLFSGFDQVSLGGEGTVAFLARLTGGGTGIFTGSSDGTATGKTNKVIQTGDMLFGSTVTGLDFHSEGLNDGGQVAFRYTLADGRNGIARAQVIPEPGSLLLATTVLAPFLGRRVLRRRQSG
jgi:hypothetical protein